MVEQKMTHVNAPNARTRKCLALGAFTHIHGESEQTAKEMFLSALQMGRRARKEDFLDTCNAVS